MTQQPWSGVFPYLPTPLDADGTVRRTTLADIVERCLAAGVHGLTPLGSSGELPYLTGDQRLAVIEGTVAAAAGRVPVVPGVGGFDTASVVRDARAAVAAGSDGILLVILAYFPLRPAEILGMIGAVTAAVEVPVVLYHHPHLTHVEFSADVIAAAHRDHGVHHVKDASGRITNVARWLDATSGGIRYFSATAVPPTAAMLSGACGWMAGPAAAFPAESVEIYDLAVRGEWAAAQARERRLDSALNVFRTLGPGRGVKGLFAALGIDVGQPVPPLAPLDPAELALIRDDLARLTEQGAA
ncbi:dihydrodipicolinate synthase family protein [Micromonospora sp. B11E3]|uniref:dihydrodipicolinate synthase family protein n=1 Tax=Micromonospora sp. B11E3 TaxID=3153562 RepID=UPI00325DC96E